MEDICNKTNETKLEQLKKIYNKDMFGPFDYLDKDIENTLQMRASMKCGCKIEDGKAVCTDHKWSDKDFHFEATLATDHWVYGINKGFHYGEGPELFWESVNEKYKEMGPTAINAAMEFIEKIPNLVDNPTESIIEQLLAIHKKTFM